MDTDRESILGFIKDHKYDYSKPIPVEMLADLLYEMQAVKGFQNLRFCIDGMEGSYKFENEEEMYEFIIELAEKVRLYREKFLVLKKE